ncbi:hypothetical protein [Pseudoalteromonas piscicida]|uniref:hypothetical protein n=1 Tax=Pseudoalteromonas piscicida TaxID=43662 RepID=UPI0030B6FEB8
MTHCNQPTYINDKHCGHCGDDLDTSMQLKTIEALQPDVFEEIKDFYPNAKLVTGRVLSTYLYKRTYNNSENNLTYSYWWIELEDTKGQVHTTSVSAEKDFFKDLKRGDILTLFNPTPFSLNYRIFGGEAKKVVQHNQAPGGTINHLEGSQKYILESAYQPGEQSLSIVWFLLSALLFWVLYGNDTLPFDSAAGITAVVAIATYLFERNVRKKRFEERKAKYQALLNTLDNLLNFSRYDLGYHVAERQQSDSDVFCFSCQKRLPAQLSYCPGCGENMTAAEVPSGNVKALETGLMKEYEVQYTEQYTHKNALYTNGKGDVYCRMLFGKVIDKPLNSSVSDVETVTTQTIRTDHYRGNSFQYSTDRTITSRHRQRNSNIEGQIVLQTSEGEARFSLGEDILGMCDIGDWLAFAYSEVDLNHSYDFRREFVYNLSKGKQARTNGFMGHSFTLSVSIWFLLGIGAFISNLVFSVKDYAMLLDLMYHPVLRPLYDMPLVTRHLPIAVFMALTVLWMVQGVCYLFINGGRRKRILKPLMDKINQFKKSEGTIKAEIEKLG